MISIKSSDNQQNQSLVRRYIVNTQVENPVAVISENFCVRVVYPLKLLLMNKTFHWTHPSFSVAVVSHLVKRDVFACPRAVEVESCVSVTIRLVRPRRVCLVYPCHLHTLIYISNLDCCLTLRGYKRWSVGRPPPPPPAKGLLLLTSQM